MMSRLLDLLEIPAWPFIRFADWLIRVAPDQV
jgi:hypothetical protein